MRIPKMLLAGAAAAALAFIPQPVTASPASVGSAAGGAVGTQVAPHDIACTKAGTLWTCRHGAAGDVVAQLQDYATCETEADCRWDFIPGPGIHASDGRWFLIGDD